MSERDLEPSAEAARVGSGLHDLESNLVGKLALARCLLIYNQHEIEVVFCLDHMSNQFPSEAAESAAV